MLRIWSFLDVPSVGRAARVCRRFRQISDDIPLWANLTSERMARGNGGDGDASAGALTRSFYVRRFLSFKRRAVAAERQRMEGKRARMKQHDLENSARALLFCGFARPFEWAAALAVVWLTVVGFLALDGALGPQFPLWAVVAPLPVLACLLCCAPLLYDLASSRHDRSDFADELDPDGGSYCRMMRPLFLFLLFVAPLNDLPVGRLWVYPPAFSCTAFLAAAVVRVLTGQPPFWVVAIPLQVACLSAALIVCFAGYGTVFTDEARLDRLLATGLIACFIVFVEFVALRADDVIAWRWALVFIPLFALMALWIAIPGVLTCAFILSDCRDAYWFEERSRWTPRSCAGAAASIVLVLAPLIAFSILLLVKLETGAAFSWTVVGIPLFVLEFVGLCACLVVSCAFQCRG